MTKYNYTIFLYCVGMLSIHAQPLPTQLKPIKKPDNVVIVPGNNICSRNNLVIDLHQSFNSKDYSRYYVTFAARPSNIMNGDLTVAGHAFISICIENDKNKITEISSYGFTPKSHSTRKIGLTLLNPMTFVPGTVESEITNYLNKISSGVANPQGLNSTTEAVTFEIDKSTLSIINAKIVEWGDKGYKLGQTDCVSFIQDIGKEIGIYMPERSFLQEPTSYISALKNSFSSPNVLDVIPKAGGNNYLLEVFSNGNYNLQLNSCSDVGSIEFNYRQRSTWANGQLAEIDNYKGYNKVGETRYTQPNRGSTSEIYLQNWHEKQYDIDKKDEIKITDLILPVNEDPNNQHNFYRKYKFVNNNPSERKLYEFGEYFITNGKLTFKASNSLDDYYKEMGRAYTNYINIQTFWKPEIPKQSGENQNSSSNKNPIPTTQPTQPQNGQQQQQYPMNQIVQQQYQNWLNQQQHPQQQPQKPQQPPQPPQPQLPPQQPIIPK